MSERTVPPAKRYEKATAYVALQDDSRWLMAVAPGGREYLDLHGGDPRPDEPTAFLDTGPLTSSGRRRALAALGYEEAKRGGPWTFSEGLWEFDAVPLLCTAAVRSLPILSCLRSRNGPWLNFRLRGKAILVRVEVDDLHQSAAAATGLKLRTSPMRLILGRARAVSRTNAILEAPRPAALRQGRKRPRGGAASGCRHDSCRLQTPYRLGTQGLGRRSWRSG